MQGTNDFLDDLDKGIDDMESGRELPLNEAFKVIDSVRNSHRDDYTKWQREYFDGIDPEQFLTEAVAYEEKNPFVGKRLAE